MEIIDSHHHLWNYQPERFPWINEELAMLKKDFNPKMLEEELKQHGISGTIAVQAVQDEDENHFLLQQADENGFIKGVIGWLDLKSSELEERLNLYVPFRKLKGFRHILQDESDPEFILKAEFQRGLGCLFEAGYVYDLLVFPHQLKGAIKTVENFPDAPFVLDHIAKPPIKSGKMGEWKELLKTLGENKNVYCKVSGMVTEANWDNWEDNDFFPYLDVAMEAFGEDRLMYGSDWPVCLLAGSYHQVFNIIKNYLNHFPSDVQAKIWAKNASVFYRL